MIRNALPLLLLSCLAYAYGSPLFAQSDSPWSFGGSLQAGVGSSAYVDHPELVGNRDFGTVWHGGIDFATWYQLTPRLSFGSGGSIRAQYFQLQTYSPLPELASSIGFIPQSNEDDYYLARVRHNSYMITLNGHAEYLAMPYNNASVNPGLYAGVRLGVTPFNNIRTLYGERDYGGKDLIPKWGTSHLFEEIPSQGAVENYFDRKMNKTPLFFQLGFVFYVRGKTDRKTDIQRIRIAVLYEGTTEALSQGFNSPLQGVSFNMGMRLAR